MSACRSIRHARGFTLLELLVVLSILGVVTTIGTMAFVGVTGAWNERKSIAELDAQARQAIESIRQDLANALSTELAPVGFRGVSRDIETDRTFPPAVLADDEFAFPVQSATGSETLEVAAQVGYRVDRSGDMGRLIRTVGPIEKAFPTTNQQEVIPRAGVLGFSVQYLADSANPLWADRWALNPMPRAVRVSIVLEDPDRPNEYQVTKEAVIPIHVR